jgi:1-acyl-sn-glycerol-3-phosphate acyltransferase
MPSHGLAQRTYLTESHSKMPVQHRPPADAVRLRILRRLVSIPLLLCLTLLTTALLPALILLALLLQLLPACRGALRTLAFAFCYLWCETAGVLACFTAWLHAVVTRRRREDPRYLASNYQLQRWWVQSLYSAGLWLYGVRLQISGEDALHGGAPILMPRHASLADTLLPLVCYGLPYNIHLAYVMKRELLWDPCLDIVGHRVPNFFIDRAAEDGSAEANGMAKLLRELPADTGLLIYPEGTRFSNARRERAMRRLQPVVTEQQWQRMQSWRDLLPPRLGGPMTLLRENPGRDLLFCAHLGFEGASHLRNLFSGKWTNALIKVHFWRIPFARIPKGDEALQAFLWTQWDQMQQHVDRLRADS